MRKELKKAEWWLQPWRESSRSRTAKGKCWPRLNPISSLSQRTLVLLLLHPEPTEAWSCQGSPWVMKPPKQEKDPIMRGLTQLTAARSGYPQPGHRLWVSVSVSMCFCLIVILTYFFSV